MRLLFVVQRYGATVVGGAEAHCRAFAVRLAARGHEVEVLTAAPGPDNSQSVEDGVVVHRLGLARSVDGDTFGPFTERAVFGGPPPAAITQDLWLRAQGPAVPALEQWLVQRAATYDTAIFFTYLFRTFWSGLAVAAGRLPVVAHATAHDEPYFWLPALDTVLRLPDVYAWSTEEERDLLRRRGDGRRPGMIIGIGVDVDVRGDPVRFRAALPRVGQRPYLLYVGRVTPGKGVVELYDSFVAYKRRRPGPLALVLLGAPDVELPAHPDVVAAGQVAEDVRNDALAGAVSLVHPSQFESFSMALCEAWAQHRPAIVSGHSEVLAGQVRRAGAGLAYRGYLEWEAAVDAVTGDPGLAAELGNAGYRYASAHYSWDAVLTHYERLLSLAGHLFVERRRPGGRRCSPELDCPEIPGIRSAGEPLGAL